MAYALHGAGASAAEPAGRPAPGAERPAISIIIDDLGYRRPEGLRAIELPGALAFAVLPHTPYGSRLAEIAFRLDKEVIVHLPMEGNPEKALGPGGITRNMGPRELEATLDAGLAAVPHAIGLSNHMGSVLTADAHAMRTLMRWMNARPSLIFVDSLTTPRSVALRTARESGIDAARRDVFLDADTDARLIRRQFMRLVAVARANGTALGIGHPYPETLEVLAQVLPRPERFGVELIALSELIARRTRAVRVPASKHAPRGVRPTAASSAAPPVPTRN